MRSAFHPLLGRFRIGASRLRPLFPKLHTSDCSSACPGSSTWVDKVPSRDTPSLNLADHREGVFPGDPQVARQRLAPGGRVGEVQAAAFTQIALLAAHQPVLDVLFTPTPLAAQPHDKPPP